MKNTLKRITGLALVLALAVTMIPAQAMAAVKTIGTPTERTELMSSDYLEHNFVNVKTEDDTMTITVETPIQASQFNISVRGVEPQTSKSVWLKRIEEWDITDNGGYYSFNAVIDSAKMTEKGVSDGNFVLLITMQRPGKTESIIFYKNCNFSYKGGKFAILAYDSIIKENKKFTDKTAALKYSAYKKTDMSDYKYLLFRDPVTGKVNNMTTTKVAYIKKVSDTVTKGATTKYEKLLKIYEYIGDKFYYDDIGFATKTKQYVDPYKNIYNLRNKKSTANSYNGKVGTTCVGYAGAVVALARAQGIPAIICNGHHVGMTTTQYNNWATEDGIDVMDHWWAECYVNGRWIIVDPTPANSNKWNRSTKKWTRTGLTNYIYFDPTPEQFATSHEFFELKNVQ